MDRLIQTCLQIQNLTAGYDRRPAIHHLTASIAEKSLLAIIGPNGGGKSTLLKTLAGLLIPMSGHIQQPDEASIAYLPQMSEMDRSFPITVFDTILMGAWPQSGFFRALDKDIFKRAQRALEAVGMSAFQHQSIRALSTGQFQRVLFARLILQDATIYLLDEPFSAIDQKTSADLLNIIRLWHEKGKTILCVLHDIDQVRQYFPQTMLLARELIGMGTTAEILHPQNMEQARRLAEKWQDHAEECLAEQAR